MMKATDAIAKGILPALPENADELIREAIARKQKEADNLKQCDAVLEVLDDVREHCETHEQFAIWGKIRAFALNDAAFDDDGETSAFIGVLFENSAYHYCDEFNSGMLNWAYNGNKKDRGWFLVWFRPRWLHLHELDQSVQQIAETITAEVEAGQNSLTGIKEKG